MEGIPEDNNHMIRCRSGIKYRSICQRCNGDILGTYDKAYKEFVQSVAQELHIQRDKPVNSIVVSTQINKVCRAMIGHVLAARSKFESEPIPENEMRAYFLDEKKKMEGIRLYTWLYPYSTIIILRDYVARGYSNMTHPYGVISHVSSYPLAYLVAAEEQDCWIDDLGVYTTENIDDSVAVTLHSKTLCLKETNIIKSFSWPCNIGDESYGDAMMILSNSTSLEDSRLAIGKNNLS